MADNVTLPGTGEVVATDDIGGVQYQQMKLVDGTLNSAVASKVDANNRLFVSDQTLEATATLGALNAAATVGPTNGELGWSLMMRGTASMTLIAEGSDDNTNWFTLANGEVLANTGANWAIAPSMSNTFSYATGRVAAGHTGGSKYFRIRVSAYTSGSATVVLRLLRQPLQPLQPVGGTAVTQATASNLNAQVVGNVGSGATDSGNPVKVGGIVVTGAEAVATNAQRVNSRHDKVGRPVVRPYQHRERVVKTTFSTTNSTENVLLSGQGSGIFADLTNLSLFNSSATTTNVSVRSVSGGTIEMVLTVPAGGGVVVPFPVPMTQTTANSAWTLQSSTGVSTLVANAVFILEQ